MLSRIADNLYWMSRYLERAHNTSRLIGINLLHLVETEEMLAEHSQWRPLLSITGNEVAYLRLYPGEEITATRAIHFITRENANPNSILNCLRMARENARIVRDRISKEMWESMNDFWLKVDDQLHGPLPLEAWPEFHKFVRNGVALFHGLTVSTMMRGEGLNYYQLGTFLERADMTARILDVRYHLLLPDPSMVGSPLDYYQWAALLKTLSGFEAYRRKVHAGFRPIDVAEFVILEKDFPRSLWFCIQRLYEALLSLRGSALQHSSFNIMSGLLEEWSHLDVQEVFFKKGLHEFLREFLKKISSLHLALEQDFFTTYVGE
jgi:uncharacterized alpha-E superfamily protein